MKAKVCGREQPCRIQATADLKFSSIGCSLSKGENVIKTWIDSRGICVMGILVVASFVRAI